MRPYLFYSHSASSPCSPRHYTKGSATYRGILHHEFPIVYYPTQRHLILHSGVVHEVSRVFVGKGGIARCVRDSVGGVGGGIPRIRQQLHLAVRGQNRNRHRIRTLRRRMMIRPSPRRPLIWVTSAFCYCCWVVQWESLRTYNLQTPIAFESKLADLAEGCHLWVLSQHHSPPAKSHRCIQRASSRSGEGKGVVVVVVVV